MITTRGYQLARSFTRTPLIIKPILPIHTFHSSFKTNEKKIHSNQNNILGGPLSMKFAQTETDLSEMEERLSEKAHSYLDDYTVEERKSALEKVWLNKDLDLQKLMAKDSLGGGFAEDQFENWNLDSDTDFGKAMNYIAIDNEEHRVNEMFHGETSDEDIDERFPMSDLLFIGRHAHVTAGGRIFSYSALVMLGDGEGAGGIGYARANSVTDAVSFAKNNALKNVVYLNLWRGNNIGGDIKIRYKNTYFWMKARRPGYGRVAGYDMTKLLDFLGITDVSVGRGGNRNKKTLYRAIFIALRDGVTSPETIAAKTGRKLFDRSKAYYNKSD